MSKYETELENRIAELERTILYNEYQLLFYAFVQEIDLTKKMMVNVEAVQDLQNMHGIDVGNAILEFGIIEYMFMIGVRYSTFRPYILTSRFAVGMENDLKTKWKEYDESLRQKLG